MKFSCCSLLIMQVLPHDRWGLCAQTVHSLIVHSFPCFIMTARELLLHNLTNILLLSREPFFHQMRS